LESFFNGVNTLGSVILPIYSFNRKSIVTVPKDIIIGVIWFSGYHYKTGCCPNQYSNKKCLIAE
ncbi:MAG: hypothetical protein KAJ10_11585, partial [Thermodesulfovibrionia bacterium]|nr:hypothetical protein [Thermodesulfovibrionia bacterium]